MPSDSRPLNDASQGQSSALVAGTFCGLIFDVVIGMLLERDGTYQYLCPKRNKQRATYGDGLDRSGKCTFSMMPFD